METFLLIIFLFFFILIIIGKISTTNTPKKNYTKQQKTPQKPLKPLKEGFQSLPLRGWNHYTQNHNLQSENFNGTAILDHNKHDYYSIGIYYKNRLIGFLPKSNNHSLYNFINDFYSGTIPCYGYYDYDRTIVTIPAFSDKEIIDSINLYFEKIKKLKNLQENTATKNENYFEILNLDIKIQNILKKIPTDFNPNYRFIKKYINEFSIILNKNKDFENILKLKNYDVLIQQLSIKDQEAIYKKIEKAETQLLN